MLANPGRAIYLLLARDFAPLPDRLNSLARRLAAVPDALAAARSIAAARLPRVHLETAISQFEGTGRLIGPELDRTLAAAPDGAAPAGLTAARTDALDAITAHRRWLEQRLADGAQGEGFRDPRIGPELFARKLFHTLESGTSPEELLARAQADLDETTEQITETAARVGAGGAGRVLSELAADAPDDRTILGLVQRAYHQALAFSKESALVTAHDDAVDIIEMPEIDRGVAVAYCDAPGPLETGRAADVRGRVAHARGTGRPTGCGPSTGSTTGTWCRTSWCMRRCPGTCCSWRTPAGSAAARRCGPRSGPGRSSRAGRCTPRS